MSAGTPMARDCDECGGRHASILIFSTIQRMLENAGIEFTVATGVKSGKREITQSPSRAYPNRTDLPSPH
jgi:hypothetical protein